MQAPRYERHKDFTQDDGDQTDHPALNAEFDGVADSIQGMRANLAKIQRDDGALQEGIVNADTLDPQFKADLTKELSGNIDGKLKDAQKAAQAATTAAQSAKVSQAQADQSQQQAASSEQAAQLNAVSSAANARQALADKEAAHASQQHAQVYEQHARTSQFEAGAHAQASHEAAAQSIQYANHAAEHTAAAEDAAGVAQDSAVTAQTAAALAKKKVEDATQLGTPADKTVSTPKLVKGAVTTPKLADHAVTLPKLAPGSVRTDKLAEAAVTTEKLADGVVTMEKLALEAVCTDKLVDAAVTAKKLAAGAAIKNIGYTPADAAEKGQPRGLATLNAQAQVPDAQLQGAFSRGSGYQRLPSGLILQWGCAEKPNPFGQDIVYPMAFPKAVFCIMATGANGQTQSLDTISVKSRDTQHFSLYCAYPGGRSIVPTFWLALGC